MEMSYTLEYKDKALEDIQYFKSLGDETVKRKINALLDELEEHPLTGMGEPDCTPGIQVSGTGYTLKIYGQTNQSGQLIIRKEGKVFGAGGAELR